MGQQRFKISLYLNYFVFAILLNSVGIVILKSIKNFGVNEVQASTLELFKDLPIAICSFVIASFLPRLGYKKAMIIALSLVSLACLGMYFGNSFGAAQFLFAAVGVSFALIKVSVYASIGLLTSSASEHNSLMSSIEGFFMVGIAAAYFLFPAFNHDTDPNAWLNVYILLAALAVLSLVFLYFTPFQEPVLEAGVSPLEDTKQMYFLMTKTAVLVFLMAAFLFVMVEQGIMTWLPTFNHTVLHIPENIGIMMASILALSLALGRVIAGVLAKKYHWIYILSGCLVGAMACVIFILPKTMNVQASQINSLVDVPILAYAFPLVGLFIAPIYPLINSAILSSLPKKLHSPMTGLIVIFSALGGTLGSRIIGWLFKNVGGNTAFFYTLIPMALLWVSLLILNRLTSKANA